MSVWHALGRIRHESWLWRRLRWRGSRRRRAVAPDHLPVVEQASLEAAIGGELANVTASHVDFIGCPTYPAHGVTAVAGGVAAGNDDGSEASETGEKPVLGGQWRRAAESRFVRIWLRRCLKHLLRG